jgi:fatty acid/phospholipid biosynthesis enzyme
MNIGLDMMGGDFSPLEAVKGVRLYLQEIHAPVTIWLVGDESKINPLLEEFTRAPDKGAQRETAVFHCHWFSFAGYRENGRFYQRRKHRGHARGRPL